MNKTFLIISVMLFMMLIITSLAIPELQNKDKIIAIITLIILSGISVCTVIKIFS